MDADAQTKQQSFEAIRNAILANDAERAHALISTSNVEGRLSGADATCTLSALLSDLAPLNDDDRVALARLIMETGSVTRDTLLQCETRGIHNKLLRAVLRTKCAALSDYLVRQLAPLLEKTDLTCVFYREAAASIGSRKNAWSARYLLAVLGVTAEDVLMVIV